MKTQHFFKAKSRLGLINPPMRHTEINRGVEDAPDHIISQEFLNTFPESETTDFAFTQPEKVELNNYYAILSRELKDFTDTINKNLKPNQTQVVIGGDNSVTFSSFLAVIERLPDLENVGYLQFDSHGEMHLHTTSISKNFHGMYMRPFFDSFDVPEIDQLVNTKISPKQVLTIGDLIFDDGDTDRRGERSFYGNIRNIDRNEYLTRTDNSLNEISNFLNKYDHVHVNYDIDVYKAESVGPSGMGDEGVWLWEDTLPIIKLLNKKQNISLDIVEVNPLIPGAEKTVNTAQQIISLILS
jgi:arginase family enzyme